MNVLDILFPKNCLGCGKSGGYICGMCITKVPFATTCCPVCTRFSFYGKTHSACKSDLSLDGVVSLWEHKGLIKNAISQVKYKFAYDVVSDVVANAAIEVNKFKLSGNIQCAAVPLHRQRENWRGFNQSERFAEEVSRALGWQYVPSLLVRTKHTEAQVHLHKKKRLRNIRGKIAVNTDVFDKIDVKNPLIIVDDVWTTGATLKECGRVLKQKGIKEVWGLTIAKA